MKQAQNGTSPASERLTPPFGLAVFLSHEGEGAPSLESEGALRQGTLPSYDAGLGSPIGVDRAELRHWTVSGSDIQKLEVLLPPQGRVLSELGGMIFKDVAVEMRLIALKKSPEGSRGRNILLAPARYFASLVTGLLSGESAWMAEFSNPSEQAKRVAFGAPKVAKFVPVDLGPSRPALIAVRGAFAASLGDITLSTQRHKRLSTAVFGGAGLFMQRFEGQGTVFLHGSGNITERTLSAAESIDIDPGYLLAFEPQVTLNVRRPGKLLKRLFDGENLFFANLCGPGKVWIQAYQGDLKAKGGLISSIIDLLT